VIDDGRVSPSRDGPAEGLAIRGRILLLISLLICTFLTALDVLVVGTAMPTIVSQLGGVSLYTWVFSSYLLASTVTVPVYGKLADTYGRKPVYTFGTVVFLFGSVMCGFAQDMTQLILFRVIQGFGAGAVFPTTLTIIGDQFSLEQRARIIGLFSAVWGISGIIGPLIGGFITDYWNWRWIFFVNFPIGVVALAMLSWRLHERVERHEHQIDYVGAAGLTAALTALMIGLLQLGESYPSLSIPGLGLFALAGLLLALFGWHEARVPEPILPLGVLRTRLIAVSGICMFLSGMTMAGPFTFVPVFAQGVLSGTATMAGGVLIPSSVTWTLGSIVGGRLLLKFGYRRTAVLGTSIVATGTALLSLLNQSSSVWSVLLATSVFGLGMGVSVVNFTLPVQNAVGWEQRGVVTSTNQFCRSIGQAIGLNMLGIVFNLRMESQLGSAGQSLAIANQVLDPIARRALDPAVLAGVRGILDGSLHAVFLVVLGVTLANIVMATQLPGGNARETDVRERVTSREPRVVS